MCIECGFMRGSLCASSAMCMPPAWVLSMLLLLPQGLATTSNLEYLPSLANLSSLELTLEPTSWWLTLELLTLELPVGEGTASNQRWPEGGGSDLHAVGRILPTLTALSCLNIGGIDDDGMGVLAPSLIQRACGPLLAPLTNLCFSSCNLGHYGAAALSSGLQVLTALLGLEIDCPCWDDGAIVALAPGLSHLTALSRLKLSGPGHMLALQDVADLTHQQPGPTGCTAAPQSQCKCLINVTAEQLRQLWRVIGSLEALTQLELSGNALGDAGAVTFIPILQVSECRYG